MTKKIIKNAMVLDMLSSEPQPLKSDLLFSEKGIEKIGQLQDLSAEEVIDGTDLWVMPGLVDLHFHPFLVGIDPAIPRHMNTTARNVFLAQIALKEWLNSGVTTVRSGGAHDNLDLELREMITLKRLIGPRLYAAGSLLAMDAGLRIGNENIAQEFSGPDEARAVARTQIKAGVDQLKIYAASSVGGGGGRMIGPSGWDQLNQDEIQAIVEEGNHANVPSFAHTGNAQSVKNCVTAGVHCCEHATDLDDEAIAMLKEKDIPIVPTLTIGWSLATFGEERGFGKHIAQMAQQQQKIGYNSVIKANKAGVRVGTGTDADSTKCLLREECRLLVEEVGFSPYQALRSATVIPGQILRAEDKIGTLKIGAYADFLILNADPTQDINNLAQVQGVIKDGDIVFWKG